MRWQFTVIAVAALALIAAGCARVKPRPQCDFYAYKENRAAAEVANIIRLTRAVRRHNGLWRREADWSIAPITPYKLRPGRPFMTLATWKPRLRPPGKFQPFEPCRAIGRRGQPRSMRGA